MCWYFLGIKIIGRPLPQEKLDNSPFLPDCPRETFVNPPIHTAQFSTISTHNQYFGPSIMALTANTHLVKFGDSNVNCGHITGSFNTTIYKSKEDAKIMGWLSPLKPENRHDSVRTNRFEGVGDWLLETSEYRGWKRGEGGADKAVLFCSGHPGVGKTFLRYHRQPHSFKEANITDWGKC